MLGIYCACLALVTLVNSLSYDTVQWVTNTGGYVWN